ncbi:MAG: carbohydrate kinase family protein [Bacillota bacterium]
MFLEEKNNIVIIGGSNYDLKAYSENYIRYTSNPGKVETSLGGVGRNIAENLGILGENVTLLSAVGDDHFGKKLLKETKKSKVNISSIKIVEDIKTGLYLAHLDKDGDLIAAIAAMEIMDYIDKNYIKEKIDIIKNAELLIIDTNIPAESIEYALKLSNEFNITNLVETVSVDKTKKLNNLLNYIDYLTPNLDEVESLFNLKNDSVCEFNERIARVKREYLKREEPVTIFVSCGEKGVLILSEQLVDFLDAKKISEKEIKETTGAGDALLAGIAHSLVKEKSIKRAVKFGMKAAVLTIKSNYTVNPDLKKLLKED